MNSETVVSDIHVRHRTVTKSGVRLTAEVIDSHMDDGSRVLECSFYKGFAEAHSITEVIRDGYSDYDGFLERVDAHWEGFCENLGALKLSGKEDVLVVETSNGDTAHVRVRWVHETALERNEEWGGLVKSCLRKAAREIEVGGNLNVSALCRGHLLLNDERVNYDFPKEFRDTRSPTNGIMRDIEETIRCADVVQTAPGECKTLTFYYFTEALPYTYESFTDESCREFWDVDIAELTVAQVEVTITSNQEN